MGLGVSGVEACGEAAAREAVLEMRRHDADVERERDLLALPSGHEPPRERPERVIHQDES